MDLRTEPVRIPGYVGLGAAMLLAGITAYVASASLLATAAAALSVIVPGAAAVEYARSHAWSPASVDAVVTEAHNDDPAGPTPDPDRLLSDARAFHRY